MGAGAIGKWVGGSGVRARWRSCARQSGGGASDCWKLGAARGSVWGRIDQSDQSDGRAGRDERAMAVEPAGPAPRALRTGLVEVRVRERWHRVLASLGDQALALSCEDNGHAHENGEADGTGARGAFTVGTSTGILYHLFININTPDQLLL